MARRVKLLSGDRMVADDVMMIREGRILMDMRETEIDKIIVDAERWLDGATVSTAVSDNTTAMAAVLATPLVTLTFTAPSEGATYRLTVTASDGRKRVVDFELSLNIEDPLLYDYGFSR